MHTKMLKGAGMGAKRKIEIRKVSRLGIWITLFLALAFVFLLIAMRRINPMAGYGRKHAGGKQHG